MERKLHGNLLPKDEERARNNRFQCPFRARKCDGLCNNCPQDLDGSYPYDYGTAPVRRSGNMKYPDYEEAILTSQESYYE